MICKTDSRLEFYISRCDMMRMMVYKDALQKKIIHIHKWYVDRNHFILIFQRDSGRAMIEERKYFQQSNCTFARHLWWVFRSTSIMACTIHLFCVLIKASYFWAKIFILAKRTFSKLKFHHYFIFIHLINRKTTFSIYNTYDGIIR